MLDRLHLDVESEVEISSLERAVQSGLERLGGPQISAARRPPWGSLRIWISVWCHLGLLDGRPFYIVYMHVLHILLIMCIYIYILICIFIIYFLYFYIYSHIIAVDNCRCDVNICYIDICTVHTITYAKKTRWHHDSMFFLKDYCKLARNSQVNPRRGGNFLQVKLNLWISEFWRSSSWRKRRPRGKGGQKSWGSFFLKIKDLEGVVYFCCVFFKNQKCIGGF